MGSWEAGMQKIAQLLLISAESGLSFLSFFRKLRKITKDPVNPV
jgi:hypothetical protein